MNEWTNESKCVLWVGRQNGCECKNVGGRYNDNDDNGDGGCSGIDVTHSDKTNEKANATYMKSK